MKDVSLSPTKPPTDRPFASLRQARIQCYLQRGVEIEVIRAPHHPDRNVVRCVGSHLLLTSRSQPRSIEAGRIATISIFRTAEDSRTLQFLRASTKFEVSGAKLYRLQLPFSIPFVPFFPPSRIITIVPLVFYLLLRLFEY